MMSPWNAYARVTAKGWYLGKVSDFGAYFVANKYLTTNYSTTELTVQQIDVVQGHLVSLGLLTSANGVYTTVSSTSTVSSTMRLTGIQTRTGNLSSMMTVLLFQVLNLSDWILEWCDIQHSNSNKHCQLCTQS